MYTKIENIAKHLISIRSQEDSYRRIIINSDCKTKKHYIDFFVANYKDNDGKEIIEYLSKNEPINLIQDTSYPYDQFAVSIWTSDAIKLGYVPEIISSLISYKLEDKSKRVNAVIKKIKLNAHDECKIEIRVFVDKIKKLID